MQMTNQEIWSKYDRKKKETKSKRELKAYRRTLAELNGCSEEDIVKIVDNEDNKWISYEGIEPTVEVKHTEARPDAVKAKKAKVKKLTIKKAGERDKLTHKEEEEEIIAKEYRAYGGVIEGGEKNLSAIWRDLSPACLIMREGSRMRRRWCSLDWEISTQ